MLAFCATRAGFVPAREISFYGLNDHLDVQAFRPVVIDNRATFQPSRDPVPAGLVDELQAQLITARQARAQGRSAGPRSWGAFVPRLHLQFKTLQEVADAAMAARPDAPVISLGRVRPARLQNGTDEADAVVDRGIETAVIPPCIVGGDAVGGFGAPAYLAASAAEPFESGWRVAARYLDRTPRPRFTSAALAAYLAGCARAEALGARIVATAGRPVVLAAKAAAAGRRVVALADWVAEATSAETNWLRLAGCDAAAAAKATAAFSAAITAAQRLIAAAPVRLTLQPRRPALFYVPPACKRGRRFVGLADRYRPTAEAVQAVADDRLISVDDIDAALALSI